MLLAVPRNYHALYHSKGVCFITILCGSSNRTTSSSLSSLLSYYKYDTKTALHGALSSAYESVSMDTFSVDYGHGHNIGVVALER